MVIRGDRIIEDAFALLGAFAPGTNIEDALLAQGIRFANSKIEELYENAAAIPGVTIQDLAAKAGQSEYWVGPTGAAQTPPGLRTSGELQSVVRATLPSGDTEDPRVEVVYDLDRWIEVKRGYSTLCALYLHDGSGSELVGAARSALQGNRKLEVFPAPRSDFLIRLYMRVPEIQSIDKDTIYDLPPGVHRLLTTNIAEALVPVFGADAQTSQEIRANAGMASAEYQKKNLRGSRGVAELDSRWVTSVAVGDDYVHIPEYD